MGSLPDYPYRTWTDGQWHEIHPSDYESSIPKLRSIFHQWANGNRHKLHTVAIDDDTLAIRFVKNA